MSVSITEFENDRWRTKDQSIEFRHRAADSLLTAGPVLDIGCGDGLLLSLLKERGIEARGVDLSSEAVAKCREKGLVADEWSAETPLPYADDSFECVVLLDVLEHVYVPTVLLEEAKRVSRRHLIIGVPNFSSLPARLQVVLGGVPENNRPYKTHVYWFNWRVLTSLLASLSLSLVARRMNTFGPFALFGDVFQRLMPNLFALSFIVKVEKK